MTTKRKPAAIPRRKMKPFRLKCSACGGNHTLFDHPKHFIPRPSASVPRRKVQELVRRLAEMDDANVDVVLVSIAIRDAKNIINERLLKPTNRRKSK